jgi:hypothetical protein
MYLQIKTKTTMAVIIMSHDVKDFASWKPIYDADADRRINAGFKELAVGTQADNPKKVIMIWEGDPSPLDQMLQDPELKEKMEEAGVIGKPEFTVINT